MKRFSPLVVALLATASALPGQSSREVRTGPLVMQEAYLKAVSPDRTDEFGHAIAVYGDTVVVGAPYEDSDATGVNGFPMHDNSPNSGAAYVYVRLDKEWVPQAYLKAEVNHQSALFGSSVAIFEDVIAVGAPQANGTGEVTVFRRVNDKWHLEQTLTSFRPDYGDLFGTSVSLAKNQLLIGAPGEDGKAKGVGGDQNDNSKTDSGAAFVFSRSNQGWRQKAYIKSLSPTDGDYFGKAVALSVRTAVIGVPREDSNATGVNGDASNNLSRNSGAAYVYVRGGGTGSWTAQAYLKPLNTGAFDHFGRSVAIAGETVIIGAPLEDSDSRGYNGQGNDLSRDSGAAYVFARSGDQWAQHAYLKSLNTTTNYNFGAAVAVFGNTVAISSPRDSSSSFGTDGRREQVISETAETGSVQVFFRELGLWFPSIYSKAMNAGQRDQFGGALAMHKGIMAVGAQWEDSAAQGVNGDPSDNSKPHSGAAYCLNLAPDWGMARYGTYFGANYADLYGLNLPVAGRPFTLSLREFTGGGAARLWLSRAPDWVVHQTGGVIHIDTDPQQLLIRPDKFVYVPIIDHAPGFDYAGRGTFTMDLPASAAGFTLYAQAGMHDPAQPTTWALSNGLKIVVSP